MEYTDLIHWCIEQHKKTNHFYDQYLPYEFHLRMVASVYDDFSELLPKRTSSNFRTFKDNVLIACWGHDLIEDTRVSYNDVEHNLGSTPANIIYALTNEKGKNRKERANEKYYEGIRNTSGAVFVKLCDRIANVKYSKMTKSHFFELYNKENEDFILKLGFDQNNPSTYSKMFFYLIDLFKN